MTSAGNREERLVVVVRTTTRCSFGCRYCGFARDVRRSRADIDLAKLSAFGRALSDYQLQTKRPIHVSWLGGEPFQWPDLKQATELFSKEFNINLGITTAGIMLGDAELRKWTIDHFAEITMSIDGLQEDHDQLRQMHGGYSRLQRVCREISANRVNGRLKLRINMVLTRSTISRFVEACRVFADWGVDEITFNQLGGNDRPEFYPENRLRPAQIERFVRELPRLRDELSTRGVAISGGESYLERFRATVFGERIPIDDCLPGEHFLFVDEAGRVAPCSFSLNEYSVRLEELTGAADIARLPIRLRSLRDDHRCAACSDCHATHVFDKFRFVKLHEPTISDE